MCVNYKIFDPSQVKKAGNKLSGQVACGSFTCSMEAKVSENNGGSDDDEYWFLYVDTGYYYMCDGNNIYYYEQFCSFYKCSSQDGCWTSEEMIYDDTGVTKWESISLTGSWLTNSVKYVMSSDSRGNVYSDIMDKVEIKTSTVGGIEETTASATDVNQVLINLSVLGRSYDLDVEYVD